MYLVWSLRCHLATDSSGVAVNLLCLMGEREGQREAGGNGEDVTEYKYIHIHVCTVCHV